VAVLSNKPWKLYQSCRPG